MSIPIGAWGAPQVAYPDVHRPVVPMVDAPVGDDVTRIDYAANCYTDGVLGLADFAGIEFAKASRAVSGVSSRRFSLAVGYPQAFARVLVSQDLAGFPQAATKAAGRTKPWQRNVDAFVDGLSRTFGIFSTSRRHVTAEDTVDNVLTRIEKAIDTAHKRGIK